MLVELNSSGQIQNVRWHGVLSDGTTYESDSLPLTSTGAEIIGTLAHVDGVPTKDETPHHARWWTKAHLDETWSLITTAKGYDVTNHVVKRPKV